MIFDQVCHDRSMYRPRRTIGQPQSLAFDTLCPLCSAALVACECPPELAGAGRRTVAIRRAALEPAVVVTYGGGRRSQWDRIDIRLSPLGSTDLDVRLANAVHALALDDAQDGTR